MAKLTVLNGPEKGFSLELEKGLKVVIGRDPSCGLTFLGDGVSRRHCEVVYDGQSCRLADLRSTNGTLLNGTKTDAASLKSGDVIQAGSVSLRVDLAPPGPVRPKRAPAGSPAAATTARPTDPFAGKVIGGCRLLEKLSEGPTHITYKARQEATKAFVTVKLLPPSVADNEKVVQRFARQATAGADFKHPNVMQTLAAGKQGGLYYIVSEYVEGATLQACLDETGPGGQLDTGLCLDVLIQIGQALEYAYDHKIIHRNIKPANIIVAADGTAKLDNLWLAKHVQGTQVENTLTESGRIAGTLGYMPPEQMADVKSVDCRADMYSLAATCYRCLTGRVPCKGKTIRETIAAVRNEVPASVREYNNKVPGSVAQAIARALAKDPNERFQTPKEFVLELKLARKYQVK